MKHLFLSLALLFSSFVYSQSNVGSFTACALSQVRYFDFKSFKVPSGQTFHKTIRIVTDNLELNGREDQVEEYIQQSILQLHKVCPSVSVRYTLNNQNENWCSQVNFCIGDLSDFQNNSIITELTFEIMYYDGNISTLVLPLGISQSECSGQTVDNDCRTIHINK